MTMTPAVGPIGPSRGEDRRYMLRAARGEIDTETALDLVRTMHMRSDLANHDPELAAALTQGDLNTNDDPRRWPTNPAPWTNGINPDPATTAAFNQLVTNSSYDYVSQALATDTDDYQWATLIIDGKTWLTSGPDHPESLWGNEHTILAAKGQPTTIAGPQGAGKSVFGQRLALGWIGLHDHLLGFPVAQGERNALYLACDRPEQARLSTRRMVADDQLDLLQERLRVWKGPPPEDVAKQPLMLLEMAQVADADLIVIDSAKDVALKLSADEIGAAYNSALQHAVAADIEIIVLHHPRKLSGETRDNPVRVLDDLYGAYWVTAGNGSVIYLQPGDFDTYTLTQLKSPIGEKAEIPYEHVIAVGNVRAPTAPDIESILEDAGDQGTSAAHIARILCKVDEPSGSQKKKVQRALNELAEDGVVESTGTTRNKKWRLVEPIRDVRIETRTTPTSRSDTAGMVSDKPQVTDSDTLDSDKSPPLLKEGDVRIGQPTQTCSCGQPATDISGLCPGCLTNPGTLPTHNPLDF